MCWVWAWCTVSSVASPVVAASRHPVQPCLQSRAPQHSTGTTEHSPGTVTSHHTHTEYSTKVRRVQFPELCPDKCPLPLQNKKERVAWCRPDSQLHDQGDSWQQLPAVQLTASVSLPAASRITVFFTAACLEISVLRGTQFSQICLKFHRLMKFHRFVTGHFLQGMPAVKLTIFHGL